MATPTLETERLILRPMQLSDAPRVQELLPHWGVVKYLATVPWPYPDDGAEDYIVNTLLPAMAAGTTLSWTITVKDLGDDLIGSIDFNHRKEHGGSRGFWLGQEFWGNGYMTEAVVSVNDYLFGELEIDKFRTKNAVANSASGQIEASGLGRFVEVIDAKCISGVQPTEVWEITREDWLASRA